MDEETRAAKVTGHCWLARGRFNEYLRGGMSSEFFESIIYSYTESARRGEVKISDLLVGCGVEKWCLSLPPTLDHE